MLLSEMLLELQQILKNTGDVNVQKSSAYNGMLVLEEPEINVKIDRNTGEYLVIVD